MRNINDTQEETKKPSENFQVSLQENWTYVINAKWYQIIHGYSLLQRAGGFAGDFKEAFGKT